MYINTDTIFSMTQANQNFSSVARAADKNGEAVVFNQINKNRFSRKERRGDLMRELDHCECGNVMDRDVNAAVNIRMETMRLKAS